MDGSYDALIIGSGVNGLAAAINLQKKGYKTKILEQASEPGGSTKTSEMTLPGFKHDIGSAIHPMAFASPFLKNLPLENHGLKWVFPDIPYSHAFEDGSALACYTDVYKTAKELGVDRDNYIRAFKSLTQNWPFLERDILGPIGWPSKPLKFLEFGLKAISPASVFAKRFFKEDKTRCFFYGAAAHSTLPLNKLASSSFGLVLAVTAHLYNWPFPEGGAQNLIRALISYYRELGGKLELDYNVQDLNKVPESKIYLFDLTPLQILKIKNTGFSSLYRRRLENFKYGAGVFKIDWALERPIPFLNEKCRRSGTVHLGNTTSEIEASEESAFNDRLNTKPYVLLAQHSVFDPTRAPQDKHTAWAYCHVPNGNLTDHTQYIEDQIERVAPGFRDSILKRKTHNTQQLELFNPNIVGGDINGGKQDITQLFTRPVLKSNPYATSKAGIFICSSSTPPGGGVHGMCGFHASERAIARLK